MQDEPDPVVAATVGVPLEAGSGGGSDAQEAVVNQAGLDVLRRLPGVSEATWRGLARAAGSLAELAQLGEATLAEAAGGAAPAAKLHAFLQQDCAALFGGL